MARARQRAEWLRVGIAVMWIVNRNGFTKEPIDPLKVIPAQFRPPPEPVPELTEEEKAEESRQAWFVLDTFFGRTG